MKRVIISNDVLHRQSGVIKCPCGKRYAGTEYFLSIVDTDKKTWSSLKCPDCVKKEQALNN